MFYFGQQLRVCESCGCGKVMGVTGTCLSCLYLTYSTLVLRPPLQSLR